MKHSLLYKDPASHREPSDAFDKLFYDLSLDKAVNAFCRFPKRAAYFTQVLKSPALNVSDITYRQQILGDFLKDEKLLEDMKMLLNRYDSVRSDWNELLHNVYPVGAADDYRALLDYTYSQMQVTATFTRTIVSYLKSFYSLLEKSSVTSEGLTSIRDYCRSMIEGKALDEVSDIASLFQYRTADSFRYTLNVSLDDTLRITESTLTDLTFKDDIKKDSVLKKLFAKKSASDPIPLGEAESDDTMYALTLAISRVSSALSDITGAIYELFYGISNEFMFYDAAVSYVAYLENHGVDYIFPTVLEPEKDLFDAKELRDLILCCDDDNGEVVPNDVFMDGNTRGILIRGRNNTGKTVFLRSLALAQLFAQSGLPVCAKEATLSLRPLICAHFSSAEEDLREGDVAGRFEGEVQLVSAIADKLVPHALVFFNETFQTTAYDEGAAAMQTVLSLLSALDAQYVFVTHLTKLFDDERDDVLRLETDIAAGRFKLRKVQ